MTCENYREQRRRKMAGKPDRTKSRLFTKQIESGIVTADLWGLIQAMPEAVRLDYEALDAESLVFYPRALIATDGGHYDRLCQELGSTLVPWRSSIDFARKRKTTDEDWSAANVSLSFALGSFTEQIGEFRRQAREASGHRKHGEEQNWKLLANSLYGTLASAFFPVGNVVAANQITAAVRPAAYAMIQALNGFQVVTDGCTYRRDQIPAVLFAECLRLQDDYPICRAAEGGKIPFLKPEEVPENNAEFAVWFKAHVQTFFAQAAVPTVERFDFEHKEHGGRTTFDALACDGAANDVKFALCPRSGRWIYLDSSRRGFSIKSKRRIATWILKNLPEDRVKRVPPLGLNTKLLGVDDAVRAARKSLRRGARGRVVVPLGFERISVNRYKPIRLSAFLFDNEANWRLISRQVKNFEKKHHLGLEALVFRRSYGPRLQGSIHYLLKQMAEQIRSGSRDLPKKFHLSRGYKAAIEARCRGTEAKWAHQQTRWQRVHDDLMRSEAPPEGLPPTGIWCKTRADLPGF